MPIMWSTGPGADVMKRIAAPMVGGLVTSFLLELLVYPAIYEIWKRGSLPADHLMKGQRWTVAALALARSSFIFGLTGKPRRSAVCSAACASPKRPAFQ